MDGIHDMGGMQGFGRVPVEQDTVFDYRWQQRAFALAETLAWSVPFSADQHRQAIERIAPADYLSCDYFDKWAMAVQTLLLEAGLADVDELRDGKPRLDAPSGDHAPVSAQTLLVATKQGAPMTFLTQDRKPLFEVGQTVRVLPHGKQNHTRTPRYVRGHAGKIVANLGYFQFADAVAAGTGPDPQFCYTVEFSATALWGATASQNDTVSLDLWEPYFEPD